MILLQDCMDAGMGESASKLVSNAFIALRQSMRRLSAFEDDLLMTTLERRGGMKMILRKLSLEGDRGAGLLERASSGVVADDSAVQLGTATRVASAKVSSGSWAEEALESKPLRAMMDLVGLAMEPPISVTWWKTWMFLVMGATLSAIKFGSFLMFSMHSSLEMVSTVESIMEAACLL